MSDNLMIGDALGQMQGIFMTNAGGDRMQLDQIKIANNLMWGTMWNGIAAFTGNRVAVTGNSLYSNALPTSSKTWVRLEEVNSATVTSNYAGAYIYDELGRLNDSGNVLSLLDALAAGAITAWDATHVASGLSLPYFDPDNVLIGDEPLDASGLMAARGLSQDASYDGAARAAVPEPAGWAMMIAGFGFIGAMRRRLQRSTGRRMARG